MALSDLAVYSEYAYSAMTEVLRQQIDLFNAASGGSIRLESSAHQGDYSDSVFFAKVSGLIRRRNAYGSGTVAAKKMTQLIDTMVKVAAGTPPIELNPGQFKWIQMNPETAGAALGQQLAIDTMADMLNTALGALYAALVQTTAIVTDVTGATTPADKMSFINQTTGVLKFGDRMSDIRTWVMHSKPMGDLYLNALTNAESLFTYGSINVLRDPFGRILLMSDSPALVTAGSPNVYHNLGLVENAVIVGQNNDFTANEETKNGDENITRTYQAEWSYELGVRGYTWDKTNGGKSPTDAALFTSTNWDKIATDTKDLAGIVIQSH